MRGLCAWGGIVMLVSAGAAAQPASFGASLGLFLPLDRLTTRADLLGVSLLPGPSVGLHATQGGEAASLRWDAAAELVHLQSEADLKLRMFYVPVTVGAVWRAAEVQELTLNIRIAAGGAVVAGGSGGVERTAAMGLTTVGGMVERGLHRLVVAGGLEAGMLWQRDPQPTFQVRLTVMAR